MYTFSTLVIPLDRLTDASCDVIEWSQDVHNIRANLYFVVMVDADLNSLDLLILKIRSLIHDCKLYV